MQTGPLVLFIEHPQGGQPTAVTLDLDPRPAGGRVWLVCKGGSGWATETDFDRKPKRSTATTSSQRVSVKS